MDPLQNINTRRSITLAFMNGLPPVEHGWTGGEIERLQFVRYLVGDVGSDPEGGQ